MTKKCLLIDSYGFIFRAFYVQPPLTSPEGLPVGAIYGFASMLIKLLQEHNPTHVAAVFDHGGKNFRHEIYPEYKAHRPDVPSELIQQFPIARTVADVFNLKSIELKGYEADDIIATLAKQIEATGEEVIVVSADKDLAQLMSDKIKIFDPTKSKFITEADILEKFGVEPAKIRDILALVGDKSDNIPGVPGFGPKTASDLINQFGSFDNLVEHYSEISSDRKRAVFAENLDKAKLSYELVELKSEIDLGISHDDLVWKKPQLSQLTEFLTSFGFKSLTSRIGKIAATTSQQFSFDGILPVSKPASSDDASISQDYQLLKANTYEAGYLSILESDGKIYLETNGKVFSAPMSFLRRQESNSINVIPAHGVIPAKAEIQNTDVIPAKAGISLSNNRLDPCFRRDDNRGRDEIPAFAGMTYVESILTDDSILKILYNVKHYNKQGVTINSYEDLSIMSYVLSAGAEQLDLSSLISKHMKIASSDPVELVKNMRGLQQVFHKQLLLENSFSIYKDIDYPISIILNKIEQAGVKFDVPELNKLSQEFEQTLAELQKKIFAIAGEEFNIGSPKQLGEVLFDKLKLPSSGKSSKTGSFSTNVDVLEDLSSQGHEIADFLLKWRQISKLKNTYTDSLPKLVNDKTGRIHTTLLQTSTSTGRLSSVEPNLQNIPIRTKEGERIRATIVPESGYKLISADYSQVELRILAEIADIKDLKEAFANDIDVHSKTASQVFGVPVDDVTDELRRKAKAINFGIIYGISGFGLANQLGISHTDAKQYIEKYFETYPGIKEYMEQTKKFASENGFVVNYLGRKCFLPTITSSNPALKSFAERAAINAPIQGAASDIVKIAMIKVDRMLQNNNFKTKVILQVHDELMFESPENEVEAIIPLIKKTMENVARFKLRVDLEVK